MADAGRVVAGSARGIRLTAPGEGTRPLTDRVKESLFGALESEQAVGPGKAFLDLYAGSGAGGIEALSRGSERAVFVEKDAGAARVIQANLERAGVTGGKVVRQTARRFLSGAPEHFAAVLVDPPYASDDLGPTLEQIDDWLGDDAIVVAKHFWRDAPPPQVGSLERYRERRFGETMLSFYRKRTA